jgi:hypothetical protein
MYIKHSFKIIFFVSTFMLAACATGTFPYRSTRADNLTFSVRELESDLFTTIESGFFAKKGASLHIFYADNECNKTYQGSIRVNKVGTAASAGLETGKMVYIRLWVENGNTVRSQEFAFRPQPDYHYTIEYIEKNKAYGKVLSKRHIRSGKLSEFTVENWNVCGM